MKKIVVTLLLLISSYASQAQEMVWNTDLKKAIDQSTAEKKPILLFFTGSDWCGWCIRLQNEVLKKPEFEVWAKQNVVLLELDYPRRTPQAPELQKQNQDLQGAFGVQGYPTIWFANATEKEGKINFEQLGRTGYVAGGPSAWIDSANEIIGVKKPTPVEAKLIKKEVKIVKKKRKATKKKA